MPFEWSEEQYQKKSWWTLRVRDLLEDWFEAIENGTVESRVPDPFYPAAIGEDVLDRMIEHIEERFRYELRSWAGSEAGGSHTDTPGFERLKPPQRLALAQQLHDLKAEGIREGYLEPDVAPSGAPGESP